MRYALCLVMTGYCLCSVASGAPPKLNSLFPTGVQRGQTVEVTASGSWDTWPVTAWMQRPGLEIVCEKDKGKLKITADANAEPGPVWLRLTNQDGATAVKPFFIGTLPESLEKEPNNETDKPQMVDASQVINGRLEKRGDIDTFGFKLAKGQSLVAAIEANSTLGSPVDPVLQICSADGFVLEHIDDARGMDPVLPFTAPAEGMYLVRVFGFPATPDSSIAFGGGDSFIYRLTLTTGPYVDHALPTALARDGSTEVRLVGWNLLPEQSLVTIAPSAQDRAIAFHAEAAGAVVLPYVDYPSLVEQAESAENKPQPLPIPGSVTGVIQQPRDEDFYSFTAKKGDAFRFEVAADELGFLLDPTMAITDASGKTLADADDARRNRDPQLDFTAPADGEYRVGVRDAFGHCGERFAYQLTALPKRPGFQLKVTPDTATVKAGATVEVTVTIERDKGFDAELEIAATGLPAGITVEPQKSTKEGDSAKSVKLVVQAAADAQSGPFQITAKGADMPRPQVARLEGDGTNPAVNHLWVTITPADAK